MNDKRDQFGREADMILEGLYLGSQEAGSAPLEEIRARGITHVLIPAHLRDFEYAYHGAAGSGLVYKQLHVEDNPRYPILPLLPEAIAFIDQGRRRFLQSSENARDGRDGSATTTKDEEKDEEGGGAGGGVLVHCQFGVSRSASFVIAYVMALRGWDFEEAFRFVGARRPAVASNLMMFRDQLKLWHRLQYSLPPAIPSSSSSSSPSTSTSSASSTPSTSASSAASSASSSIVASLTPMERKYLVRHAKNM